MTNTAVSVPIKLANAVSAATHQFTPRSTFPALDSLPRSYFLGHHKAGLDKMKTLLNQIDLVIECRDYRIPLTSRNPLLEEGLSGKERIIVYTKHDLGCEPGYHRKTASRDAIIRQWHSPTFVHFSTTISSTDHKSTSALIAHLKDFASTHYSLTGHRVLVAGMPNVGKSTLLNALRSVGVKKGKAARTGAQPGVTRKVGSAVKIVNGEDIKGAGQGATGEGVYLLDTPGVFMPYVPHAESMLKLALCGAVKDSIIQPITLADYLLYRLNLQNPHIYGDYTPDGHPTNDIMVLLEGIARRTGRLGRQGIEDVEGAAVWLVQRWRSGILGKFVLDDIDRKSLQKLKEEEQGQGPSISQARKREKESRRERMREKGARLRGES